MVAAGAGCRASTIAKTCIARLGHAEDGVVRAGCAVYTMEEEIDRLVEGVREAARA